jgi:hypothetical protein
MEKLVINGRRYIAAALNLFALTAVSQAGTWNVVTNFNAPNNPNASSLFSYGNGASPVSFVTDATTAANCVGGGIPNYCYVSGSSFPNQTAIIWNGSPGDIQTNGSTTQPNTEIYMDPQGTGGAILRFIAPTTNVYSVTGTFFAMDSNHHTTSGSVYANSVLELGPSAIGGFGSTVPINLSNLSLSAGQTIDFLVATASDASYLATGLSATITSPGGVTAAPEPATFGMIGLAALGLAAAKRLRTPRRL